MPALQGALDVISVVLALRAVRCAASYNRHPSPGVGAIDFDDIGHGPVEYALFVGAAGAALALLRLLWKAQYLTAARPLRRLVILELVITSFWFVFLAGVLVLPMQVNILDASSKFLLPSNTWHSNVPGDAVRAPEYDAWIDRLKATWPYLLAGLILLAAGLLDMLAVVHVLNHPAAPANSVPDVPCPGENKTVVLGLISHAANTDAPKSATAPLDPNGSSPV